MSRPDLNLNFLKFIRFINNRRWALIIITRLLIHIFDTHYSFAVGGEVLGEILASEPGQVDRVLLGGHAVPPRLRIHAERKLGELPLQKYYYASSIYFLKFSFNLFSTKLIY